MFSKKVMALIMSAAMLFTMNTSVFATESLEKTTESSENVEVNDSFSANRYYVWFSLEADDFADDETVGVMVENGEGKYTYTPIEVDKIRYADSDKNAYKDPWREYYADKSNNFTITAPKVVVEGYEFSKWISDAKAWEGKSDDYDVLQGEPKTYPKITDGKEKEIRYVPVLKAGGAQSSNDKIVEKTISSNAGNHTINAKINEAPAYSGGKLRASDFISEFKIDGVTYPAKDIKITTEGGKTVGSTVTVKIKKIKGASKQVNKDIKGTVLGTVKIRPIDVSEVVTGASTYTKEGQIVVKINNSGAIKSIKAIVSKKGVNSGNSKAKKLKVKKSTYDYNSSTKIITFRDGSIMKGSIKLN